MNSPFWGKCRQRVRQFVMDFPKPSSRFGCRDCTDCSSFGRQRIERSDESPTRKTALADPEVGCLYRNSRHDHCHKRWRRPPLLTGAESSESLISIESKELVDFAGSSPLLFRQTRLDRDALRTRCGSHYSLLQFACSSPIRRYLDVDRDP